MTVPGGGNWPNKRGERGGGKGIWKLIHSVAEVWLSSNAEEQVPGPLPWPRVPCTMIKSVEATEYAAAIGRRHTKHVLTSSINPPPPPRETPTWPKKHRKYNAPKKNFLWVILEFGGGETVTW